MSDRSERSERKRVNFQSSSPPRAPSSRSSVRSRDSGVGSSSSDQASSSGGRPDHRFTAQDYNEQRNDVYALQQALDEAKRKLEQWKTKFQEKDDELSVAHKANREQKALWQGQLDRNTQLEEEIKDLKAEAKELRNENIVQKEQIQEFKDHIDELRLDKAELKQQLDALQHPVGDPVMTAVGDSTKLPVRTKSGRKRDRGDRADRGDRGERGDRDRGDRTDKHSRAERADMDMKDRMRDRLNREAPREELSPPTSDPRRATRRMSISASGGKSSSKPYIEEPPTSPSSSAQYGGAHYILANTTSYGSTPRSRQSTNSSGYASNERHESGNYVFHPLPDANTRRRP